MTDRHARNLLLQSRISYDDYRMPDEPRFRYLTIVNSEKTSKGNDYDNVVFATNGNDTIFGLGGGDVIGGGGGHDVVRAGAGNDRAGGDAGNDTLLGEGGNDHLSGQSGADHLIGGEGDDSLRGDVGSDTLSGGAGDDHLLGGSGDDRLIGGDGNDSLYGGDGADFIYGGTGNDTLRAGPGEDRLVGGTGSDVFVVLWNDRMDFVSYGSFIEDFDKSQGDIVDFSGLGIAGDKFHTKSYQIIGGSAFEGKPGQLRFEKMGGRSLVQADIDGDANADIVILMNGSADASWFLL